MKLKDLVEQKKTPDGTYAGVRFDTATNKAIHQYLKDNKIPNSPRADKLHSTLLYSRKYLPDYKPAGNVSMTGAPTKFETWKQTEDPTKTCLVLQYDCPTLVARHKALMKEHGATYDHDEYKPHVTFSYDIGDMDANSLPPFANKLNIVQEYGTDLDLAWAKTKGTKGG